MTGGGNCESKEYHETLGVITCDLQNGHGGDHRSQKGSFWRNEAHPTIKDEELLAEAVNHPQHYGGKDNPYEHVKVVNAMGWSYQIGCATKYLWRTGKKTIAPPVEDLRKAIKYIELEIDRIEAKNG